MNWGFQDETLAIKTHNGLDDELLTALHYWSKGGILYRCPIGSTTDGLSVPRCVQNIIPATGGDWFSGVLHDGLYRRQAQRWDDTAQDWLPAVVTREQADNLLLEALESQGVSWLKRQTIYRAVRLGGWKAWDDNEKTTKSP